MTASAKRRVLPISLLFTVAIGLPACSNSTSGNALPQPTSGTNQQATDTATSPTEPATSKPNSPLTDTNPCSLVPQSLKTQLKLSNEERRDLGGARDCRWDDVDSTFTTGVAIRDTQGLGEFDTSLGPATDTKVGGRAAKLQRQESGTCLIAVAVTDSSRVDITTNAGGSGIEQACKIGNQVAEAVAGQLPR